MAQRDPGGPADRGTSGDLYTPRIDILLICTANQCRSPMAEGMLRTHLARRGARVDIASAGLLPGGPPATDDAVAVMAERGIDISGHVSRTIDPEVVRSTALIIGMSRQHVFEAVLSHGADLEHTFALKELVRRGEGVGGRRADETVFDWLARVGAGRRIADLLGADHQDDISDPVGRPRADYERTAEELDVLLRRLVALLIGGPPRSAAGPAGVDSSAARASGREPTSSASRH